METYFTHRVVSILNPTSPSFISNSFDLVTNLASFILVLLILWMIWFENHKIVKLMHLTQTSLKHGKLLKLVIAMPNILISIIHIIRQMEYSAGGVTNFFDMSKQLEMRLSYANDDHFAPLRHIFESNVAQQIFNRMAILLIAHSSDYFFFNQYIFFTLGLAMRDVAKEFSVEMMQSKDVQNGIQVYLSLKQRVCELNEMLGNPLLAYFFATTAYFVTGPDVMKGIHRSLKSVAEKFGFCLYFSVSMGFWIICANFHASTQNTLKTWLDHQIHHHQKCTSKESVNLPMTLQVKMQLDSMEREWSAGCPSLALSSKYFAVTNGFLGTV